MVSTRGKKKTESSNMTLEENENAENALGERRASDLLTVNAEDNVEITVGEAGNDKYEEKSDKEESEKEVTVVDNNNETATTTEVDSNEEKIIMKEVDENNDEKTVVTEINGDSADDHDTCEDDEIDEQENIMWEDEEENSEEDNEEDFIDEDEGSEEEKRGEEEDEEEDEVSEEEEATEEEGDERGNHEEKKIAGRDGGEAEANENGREAEKHNNTERVEVSSKNIKKPNQRSRKKKVGSKKVDLIDKPEPSSRKRKAKKRVESMGMIFMCSSKTKNDCYQYRVLGLPESKKDVVEKIYKGMRLFLYDLDLKLMYGIYKAVGPGGYNIEPKAFKSQFPSQVRFTVLDDCLPLAEEKFKKVIKDNYYTNTKFDCQLNSEQVKKLCKLFVASNKGQGSKKIGGTRKVEKRQRQRPIRQERTRRQRPADNKRRLPLRERERPRKRQRKAISPLPALPPPTVRSYVYERTTSDVEAYRRDPYLETRRSPYRDRRDRDPPLNRRDSLYRDGHDPYPYIERRDPYRDGPRDPYPERRDPHREPYLEPRDLYRDSRDLYLERRDPYREGRDSYLERRDSYRDSYMVHSEPYSTTTYNRRRLEPLVDRRDVYREDRDSYRRDALLERREVHPISLGTRHRNDSYATYRERPSSYAEPIYSDDYASRPAGLARQYRL